MSCGCRSAGECNHFTPQQWDEMKATSRLLVHARRHALEELLHAVNWHVLQGTALPQEIVDAAQKVEDSVRQLPNDGTPELGLPTL